MANSISIVFLTALIHSALSVAQTTPQCQFPEIEKEVRTRSSLAQSYQEYSRNMSEISDDARLTKNISSGMAVTSAVATMTLSALTFTIYETFGSSFLATRVAPMFEKSIFLAKGYAGVNILPRFLPGGAGLLAGTGLAGAIGLNVETSMMAHLIMGTSAFFFAHPDSIFLIGYGLYQIKTPENKLKIDLDEIKKSEEGILKFLESFNQRISWKVDNSPSDFKNSLSFGRLNSDHFSELAQMSQIRADLMNSLVASASMRLVLAKMTCLKP
jgi:hypothetical protein